MPRDKGCRRIHALFPTYEILVIVRAFVLVFFCSFVGERILFGYRMRIRFLSLYWPAFGLPLLLI